MKRTVLIAMVLISLLLVAGAAYAQATGYTLPWWTADGGGGTSSAAGSYTLSGTIGQPDAGSLSGGNYRLEGGFWNGTLSGGERLNYLPLIRR